MVQYDFMSDLMMAINFDFGQDYLNFAMERFNEGDFFGYLSGCLSGYSEAALNLGLIYGAAELMAAVSYYWPTIQIGQESIGFRGYSLNFKNGLPFKIPTSGYMSTSAQDRGSAYWTTLAPKALYQNATVGRNFLAITHKFQPTLGSWMQAPITSNTPFMFGQVSPQNFNGILYHGGWIQFYVPSTTPIIK